MQKPSGGIRDIAPVAIWRRATGHAIVQATQHIADTTFIDTYPNFKKLALAKDGASHWLYFLNAAYSDTVFTSAEDDEDPWVIMKLDISNAFDSLCARLVLEVLSGKDSRDYACSIKVDEDFETAVHELRAYFRQDSWYFALLLFTSGAEFLRCFLNFEALLTQTMKPQLVGSLKF